jgi:hypothetical protein
MLISIRIKVNSLPSLRASISKHALSSRSLSLLAHSLLVAPAFAAQEGDEDASEEEESATKDDADYGWNWHTGFDVSRCSFLKGEGEGESSKIRDLEEEMGAHVLVADVAICALTGAFEELEGERWSHPCVKLIRALLESSCGRVIE